MPTKKIENSQRIYQIKVTLLGTRPPIWRLLLVPADLTLEQLHDVLQVAMGWTNSHLHEFRIGRQRFGAPDPSESFRGGPVSIDESKVRLSAVLKRLGAKMEYTYDFGDGWEHGINVEKVLPPEPGLAYPVCTGGKLSAPPEDCGGIPGFYGLLEAIADPTDERNQESLEWLGDGFDPESFSAAAVNRQLKRMFRPAGNAKPATSGT